LSQICLALLRARYDISAF